MVPISRKHGTGLHGGLAPIQPGRPFTPLPCRMPAGGCLAAGIPQALLLGWSSGTWGRNTEIHLLNEHLGLRESPPPFKEHKHDLFLARFGLWGREPYRMTNCMSESCLDACPPVFTLLWTDSESGSELCSNVSDLYCIVTCIKDSMRCLIQPVKPLAIHKLVVETPLFLRQ